MNGSVKFIAEHVQENRNDTFLLRQKELQTTDTFSRFDITDPKRDS
jgi:hypothetical protein